MSNNIIFYPMSDSSIWSNRGFNHDPIEPNCAVLSTLFFKNSMSPQVEKAISEFRKARGVNFFKHVFVPSNRSNPQLKEIINDLDRSFATQSEEKEFSLFVTNRYQKIDIEDCRKFLSQLGLTRQEIIFKIRDICHRSPETVFKSFSKLSIEDLIEVLYAPIPEYLDCQYKMFNVMWPHLLSIKLNFKAIEWTPAHQLSDLMNSLKNHGPHLVSGYFGRLYYSADPLTQKDPDLNRTVHYWKKDTHRIPDKSIVHSIILIGAKPGYVYFIDPNDSYNPQKPEAQPIYIISFARLTANATNEFGTNALNSIFAFSK